MDKSIENRFFEVFKKGGVVDNCIEWTRLTYNLPVLKPREARKPDETNREKRRQKLERNIWEWNEYRDNDFSGGLLRESSPLMEEIESNLKEYTTDDEKERYVFSLLKCFGRAGCNCSVVFAPAGEINQLDYKVASWEKYKETCPEQDIQVCERMINHCKEQKEWIAQSFVDFETIGLSAFSTESNTPGYWLGFFQDLVRVFGTRLDALLLENGMDLMRIQKDSGLYVQMMRDVSLLAEYLGSETLAQRYIGKIGTDEPQTPSTDEPQTPLNEGEQEKQSGDVVLSNMLNTKRAQQVFKGAVDKGWMQPNGRGGYTWIGIGGKGKWTQLAFMCGEIYGYKKGVNCRNDGNNIPFKDLEELFGITGLNDKLTKCWEAKSQAWRTPILEMIEESTGSTSK